MELKRVDSFCLKVLLMVEAGIVVAQVLNLDSLTSMLFLITFPLTVLLWVRTIRQTFSETDMILVITCALATISVLLNAAQNNAHFSFSYLKKLIFFIMALLFFQTAFRIRADKELCAFVHKIVDCLVVFLFLMYFLRTGQMHTLNGRRTVYLTFNFSNPNMTALFLSCLYMLKMHRLFENGQWYVKTIHILQQLLMGWLVLETQSRNCFLVLALYTLLSIWMFFKSRRNLRITKSMATLFAVFPFLLVAVYMLVVNNTLFQKLFSFLVGEGKGLDSRARIWGNALQHLWKSPVIGAYFEVSKGTGAFQMHNSHLDIAVSYGILVLILVCTLLIRYLYQQGRIYENRKIYIYILGFACAILLGMGEAAVFSGGLGIYIFAGMFLLLANQEHPKAKDVGPL